MSSTRSFTRYVFKVDVFLNRADGGPYKIWELHKEDQGESCLRRLYDRSQARTQSTT